MDGEMRSVNTAPGRKAYALGRLLSVWAWRTGQNNVAAKWKAWGCRAPFSL